MGNDKFELSAKDGDLLRRLAGTVARLAAQPLQADKRDLWYRHNALEPMRPVVFCDPEGGWQEIITKDMMECSSEDARAWEWRLRQEIFWGESMGDDRVIEPYFDLWHSYEGGDWGLTEVKEMSSLEKGAYRWEGALKSMTT